MTGPAIGKFAGGDANVISRFATIRALRDQGLITQQEFNARRRANLGALLPLSAPPPSAGLDRPVPSTEQITGRLRAIGRALEMRAISVTQHAAERNMILDALMPSAPVVVANPARPPSGLMEAADAVRRLEQLRDTGYIGSDEYAKERQSIELAMQPKQPKMAPAPATGGPTAAAKPMALKQSTGPRPAIHLASYRTSKNADRGWVKIVRAHKNLVSGLEHRITRVNLGRKVTYYRLKAGPFKNAAVAPAQGGAVQERRRGQGHVPQVQAPAPILRTDGDGIRLPWFWGKGGKSSGGDPPSGGFRARLYPWPSPTSFPSFDDALGGEVVDVVRRIAQKPFQDLPRVLA